MHSDTASTSTLATTPTPSAHSSSTASQTVATTEPWWQTLAKELDERHLRKEYAEIHRLLEEATAREPHNIELLWRLARSYFDLGNEQRDPKQKERWMRGGYALAQRCLELDGNHFYANKWVAVFTSAMSEFMGTKEKILSAHKVKEYALRAIAVQPDDASTLHVLGRWCFSVADVSWIEKRLAATLIASLPESSFDEALSFFMRAHKSKEHFKSNALWIGHTYAKLKNKANARKWYRIAIEMPSMCELDHQVTAEARECLSRL